MSGRFKLLLGVGLMVVILSGALAGVAFAEDDQQDSGPWTTLKEEFLSKLAGKLGIGEDILQEAIVSTEKEMVDEAVQQGRLSQERGDALKERIDENQGLALFGHRGLGRGHGLKMGIIDLSGFLGITTEQLRDELRTGKTLAQVAEEHGKTRDELKTYIHDQMKSRLDQAVADGRLTQQRADGILASLDERLNDMIDGQMPFGGCWGGRRTQGAWGAPVANPADV